MVLLIINKLFKKFPRLLRLLLNKLSNENRDRKANTAVKRPGVYSSAFKVKKKMFLWSSYTSSKLCQIVSKLANQRTAF
jgi:hypothetical protein